MTNSIETERAELIAERAELMAKNEAATSWGAAVGARSERIKEIDRQLAALHPSAQDQKPVAWQFQAANGKWSCCDEPDDHDLAVLPGRLRPLYLSSPPAAGWDQAIEAACKICSFAIDQTHNMSRMAMAEELRDAIGALRHNAPPETGAGKSDEAPHVDRTTLRHIVDVAYCHAMTVPCFPDFKTTDKIIEYALTGHPAQGILASLPPHGGADTGVRVKPLEWRPHISSQGWLVSDEPMPCSYFVWELAGHGYWSLGSITGREVHGGIDGAKAAAQADYERRILSALSHQPAPVAANASAEERPDNCQHCKNGFRGSDIECVNGVLVDIDEFNEGWHGDVLYPPAPCHPLFCKTCSGTGRCPEGIDHDSDDCPKCDGTGYVGGSSDCQERLESARSAE